MRPGPTRTDLRHLDLVLTIAETGSISRAARIVGVTQPALSAQLRRIEASLGAPLFERRGRGVEPTALGTLFLERARRVRAELDGLADDIERLGSSWRPLRLAANDQLQVGDVGSFLAGAGLTRAIVTQFDLSSAAITRMLLDDEIDLGVLGVHPGFDGEPPTGIDQVTVIEREPFLLVLSAEDPLAEQAEIGLSQLGERPWLLPPGEPDGTDAAVRYAITEAGLSPTTPFGRQSVSSYWAQVAAGEVVTVTVPTVMPPRGSGVAVRPLRGIPIAGRHVVRWRPSAVTADEAAAVARASVTSFRRQLAMTAVREPWWAASPEHHPVINQAYA